ncbi:hypothetical protein ECH7EC508_2861, partial [Escherichia coli O157:H7 str. EC508]
MILLGKFSALWISAAADDVIWHFQPKAGTARLPHCRFDQ